MRKLFSLIILIAVLYFSWPTLQKIAEDPSPQSAIDHITSKIQTLEDNPDVQDTFAKLSTGLTELSGKVDEAIAALPFTSEEQKPKEVKKPNLDVPENQTFSVYNVEIGDDRTNVEKTLGQPQRSTLNEYGVEWVAYHQNYEHFMMVAYNQENQVVGLYTNQDLISSTKGIKRGSTKETVENTLGEPLTEIRKGFVYYKLEKDRDYDMYKLDHSFVTIFYDKHENNTVTSIQIMNENLEENKQDFYTKGSEALQKGFEYQLFDLTNAARVNHGLPILTWDDQVKETALAHSEDMAEHNYFDHQNLQGQSPFDRMKEDNIRFTVAGENLAYGQFSSIFAHEGLMNSLGHRKNILQPDFRWLGVGVAFNEEAQPYYTENFFTK
ncbi:CAP domain-containing protein [Bacillus sp. JZ8]